MIDKKQKTLSIIIPAYNEMDSIDEILKVIRNVKLNNVKKEIIIVDDGSTDETREYLEKNKKKHKEYKIIFHKKNYGKGMAIRTGIKHATGDIVIIQDADLEYDPNEYQSLINPILDGKTSVVYGSRRLNKQNKQYSGISYYFGGIGITMITNLLYPRIKITDEPTCYKVFKSDVLKNMGLKSKRFEFCPEVTAKLARKKIKIHEVPIKYMPRHADEGKKIKWKDGFEAVWTLLRYRFKKIQ